MNRSFLIVLLSFTLQGCFYNLEYFRHYPTHELAIKELEKKDIENNPDFVSSGVLVLPHFKNLSTSHPYPYAQISFASYGKKEVYFKKAELTDTEGNILFERSFEKIIQIDNERPNNIYRSLSIKLLETNEIEIIELLAHETIYLKCIVSPANPKDLVNTILFKLDLRKTKEIARST